MFDYRSLYVWLQLLDELRVPLVNCGVICSSLFAPPEQAAVAAANAPQPPPAIITDDADSQKPAVDPTAPFVRMASALTAHVHFILGRYVGQCSTMLGHSWLSTSASGTAAAALYQRQQALQQQQQQQQQQQLSVKQPPPSPSMHAAAAPPTPAVDDAPALDIGAAAVAASSADVAAGPDATTSGGASAAPMAIAAAVTVEKSFEELSDVIGGSFGDARTKKRLLPLPKPAKPSALDDFDADLAGIDIGPMSKRRRPLPPPIGSGHGSSGATSTAVTSTVGGPAAGKIPVGSGQAPVPSPHAVQTAGAGALSAAAGSGTAGGNAVAGTADVVPVTAGGSGNPGPDPVAAPALVPPSNSTSGGNAPAVAAGAVGTGMFAVRMDEVWQCEVLDTLLQCLARVRRLAAAVASSRGQSREPLIAHLCKLVRALCLFTDDGSGSGSVAQAVPAVTMAALYVPWACACVCELLVLLPFPNVTARSRVPLV